MNEKIYSFLGLAAKARKLLSGEDTCKKAVRTGNVHLVIVASDASENTKKCFTDMCAYRNIEIRFFGYKELIGRYIGKEIRSVIAVVDSEFAKSIMNRIDEIKNEGGGGAFGSC